MRVHRFRLDQDGTLCTTWNAQSSTRQFSRDAERVPAVGHQDPCGSRVDRKVWRADQSDRFRLDCPRARRTWRRWLDSHRM